MFSCKIATAFKLRDLDPDDTTSVNLFTLCSVRMNQVQKSLKSKPMTDLVISVGCRILWSNREKD